MSRSTKDSDEELDDKAARRTRTLSAQSVTDSPLRRSSRFKPINKQNDSSPESPLNENSQTKNAKKRGGTMDSTPVADTGRSLRSRKSSVSPSNNEPVDDTPSATPSKRTRRSVGALTTADASIANTRPRRFTRARSEAKTSSPAVRLTRRTRANSMDSETFTDKIVEANEDDTEEITRKTRRRTTAALETTGTEETKKQVKVLYVELDRALPNIKEFTEDEKLSPEVETEKNTTASAKSTSNYPSLEKVAEEIVDSEHESPMEPNEDLPAQKEVSEEKPVAEVSSVLDRKSLPKSKPDDKGSDAKQVEAPNEENTKTAVDETDSDAGAVNLFQNVLADQWKKGKQEGKRPTDAVSISSLITERGSESEAECDLVLVDQKAWLAAESMRAAKEKYVSDYDSDDTVIMKSRQDSLKSRKKKLEPVIEDSGDETEPQTQTNNKRKSLQKAKKKVEDDTSDESKENEQASKDTAKVDKNADDESSDTVVKPRRKLRNSKVLSKSLIVEKPTTTKEKLNKSDVVTTSSDGQKEKMKKMSMLKYVDAKLFSQYSQSTDSDSSSESIVHVKDVHVGGTASSDSENDQSSIDSDIKRLYNLDGSTENKWDDDDVPGDECRASESEYSDSNDNGSDLADFVVDDDEVEDEEESDEDENENESEEADEDGAADVLVEGEDEEGENEKQEDETSDEEGKQKGAKQNKHLTKNVNVESEESNEEEEETNQGAENENDEAMKSNESAKTETVIDVEISKGTTPKRLSTSMSSSIINSGKKRNSLPIQSEHIDSPILCGPSRKSLQRNDELNKSLSAATALLGSNKLMECSTPKPGNRKLEKLEPVLSTPDLLIKSAGKSVAEKLLNRSLSKDCQRKSTSKTESELFHKSLPAELIELPVTSNLTKVTSSNIIELNKAALTPNPKAHLKELQKNVKSKTSAKKLEVSKGDDEMQIDQKIASDEEENKFEETTYDNLEKLKETEETEALDNETSNTIAKKKRRKKLQMKASTESAEVEVQIESKIKQTNRITETDRKKSKKRSVSEMKDEFVEDQIPRKTVNKENIESTISTTNKKAKKNKAIDSVKIADVSEDGVEHLTIKKKKHKTAKLIPTKVKGVEENVEVDIDKMKGKRKKKDKENIKDFNIDVDEANAIENFISTKKKTKAASTSLVPEQDLTRKLSKKQQMLELDAVNKKDKKFAKSVFIGEDNDVDKVKGKRKKKEKGKSVGVDIDDNKVDVTENFISSKEKCKLLSSTSQEPRENLIQKLTKKQKKRQREVPQDLHIENNSLTDANDMAQSIAFSKARDEALEVVRRTAESIKLKKEMKKQKNKEHQQKTKLLKEQHEQPVGSQSLKIKAKEVPKTGIKRLPSDVLENLSDVPRIQVKKRKVVKKEEAILPSRSSSSTGFTESSLDLDGSFIPLSSQGSTTQFGIINLQKLKKQVKKSTVVTSFRQKMLSRNPRQPVSAYLMYLEKQKASGMDKFHTKKF